MGVREGRGGGRSWLTAAFKSVASMRLAESHCAAEVHHVKLAANLGVNYNSKCLLIGLIFDASFTQEQ